MVNGNGVVVGCMNSRCKIRAWEKKECNEHKGLSTCSSIYFAHFPKFKAKFGQNEKMGKKSSTCSERK